jgi:hypothetical protein
MEKTAPTKNRNPVHSVYSARKIGKRHIINDGVTGNDAIVLGRSLFGDTITNQDRSLRVDYDSFMFHEKSLFSLIKATPGFFCLTSSMRRKEKRRSPVSLVVDPVEREE